MIGGYGVIRAARHSHAASLQPCRPPRDAGRRRVAEPYRNRYGDVAVCARTALRNGLVGVLVFKQSCISTYSKGVLYKNASKGCK